MNKDWAEFHRLTKKQEAIYHRWASGAGITDTKFWILYAICESGGSLCQNAICDDFCYSKQTVNGAVAAMEEEGILHLQFAEGSKKQKNLHLTAKGEEFCDKYVRPVLNGECRSVMKLPEEERRMFFSVMEKLLRSLEGELSAK